ncbi:MAG: hypothetical protein R6U37_03720 [Dehalococcoidia bacterium]
METSLRCGKCGDPICPKCAVQTPVGMRCPKCANLTRLPVFQVSIRGYLKAVGVGLGAAGVLGVAWGLVVPYMAGFGYLLVLVAGYLIGESISRAANRKRSIGLQVISGGNTAICFGVAVAFGLWVGLYSLIALAAGIFLAVSRFR